LVAQQYCSTLCAVACFQNTVHRSVTTIPEIRYTDGMPTRIQKPRLAFQNRLYARGGIVREDSRRQCGGIAGNCRPKCNRERRTCHRLGSISKDPIGFAAGDVNQYRYVGNGPTNATDPSGLDPPLSPMGPGSHIYDPGYGGKQLPAFVKRPTGVEEGGVFKGFPKLPIPEGTTIVKIEPGSRHDRMAGIAGEWALRVADGDESVQCVFPANSRISERIWNSKHNRLMDTLRTWFVKGANEYSLKEDYTSGIIVVKYETPKRDFVRDVGKILLPTGGDYHIEMLGSFLLQYEATIKPNSNEVCFKGRIYNVLTVESLFRNPINRKPTINGNFSRVYMVIEIEHTRPLRPVPPKR
jgi:hypothetical protein